MKKQILITNRTIKKFEISLHEQERSSSTISNYIREIKALQFYADCEPIEKSKFPPCLHMHRPQDRDAGEVSAVTFFAALKLYPVSLCDQEW